MKSKNYKMSFLDSFKTKTEEIKYYEMGRMKSYVTPEFRMKHLKYVDPISLNFKCQVMDFLFACNQT